MKGIIYYYSKTGNTKFCAEKLAEFTGFDICEVVDEKIRNGLFAWFGAGFDAIRKKLTTIKSVEKKPQDYDLIVIGQPVWAGHAVPAIRTFVKEYDLTGKNVALFITMAGTDNEKTLVSTKEMIEGKVVLAKQIRIPTKGNQKRNQEKIIPGLTEWAEEIKKIVK